jgi:hypothetical protein
VDESADAEVQAWDVRIDTSLLETRLNHYLRIKIFTPRGQEAQGTVSLAGSDLQKIEDVEARTTKPDGTVVELKKDQIFEKEVVKHRQFKVKTRTFAFPALVPGAVVEYRWREVRPYVVRGLELPFQKDIPVQQVKYTFDIGLLGRGMITRTFNAPEVPLVKEKGGFYSVTARDVPAFLEEPHMPPENEVRRWMLVLFTVSDRKDTAAFWRGAASRLHEEKKRTWKPNGDLQRAATAAVGDATAPEEKIERLFDYCRSEIRNLEDADAHVTPEEKAKLEEETSPAGILKRGFGDASDVNDLFAALATAAGFDVREAHLADRTDGFYRDAAAFPSEYFLKRRNLAVKIGEGWLFVNPGARRVPFGMLPWPEEGMSALVADPKAGTFMTTPISAADKSVARRTGRFRLLEDGTLEGDVRVVYSGHLAQDHDEWSGGSAADREEALEAYYGKRMASIEMSKVESDDGAGPGAPASYSFHVRVPGFAQKTGTRLLLQPSFFERGAAAWLDAAERRHGIYFPFRWSEEDVIEIDLPAGFELETGERPEPLHAPNVADYELWLGLDASSNRLVCKRKLRWHGLIFPPTGYKDLKQLLDTIRTQDAHTVTLKSRP